MLKAEPACGRAIPGDDIAVGIGKELCGADHFCMGELIEILIGQSYLRHPKSGEMRANVSQAGEHVHRDRLKHGVRRRRQHSETYAVHSGSAHANLAWLRSYLPRDKFASSGSPRSIGHRTKI